MIFLNRIKPKGILHQSMQAMPRENVFSGLMQTVKIQTEEPSHTVRGLLRRIILEVFSPVLGKVMLCEF